MTAPSALDSRLVGLERGPGEHELSFEIVPHLCRGDGALYGGTALAASLAAMELVTGRPALWATAQLVASAGLGDVVRCEVELVARGTYIDQVRIAAHVDDRLLFASVGSAATGREHGIAGVGLSMPDAVAPEKGLVRFHPRGGMWSGDVGHHRVSDFLDAPRTDGVERRPGHLAMWARLTDEPSNTAAKLGFLADMGVAHAICNAAGVAGAGTSLDNSLRVVVHIWSPDGVLLATGSQSVKLRTFAAMVSRGPERF